MKDNTITCRQAQRKVKEIERLIKDYDEFLEVADEQKLRDIINRKLDKLRKDWHYYNIFI